MLDSILRIVALIRKELLAVLSDPRGRFTLFFPPVFQCLIFGYAATFDLTDVPYAVLDQDRSAASRELLGRLDGSGIFHRVADIDHVQQAEAMLNLRRALLVVHVGPDFERRLLAGQRAEIQLLADARNSNTAGTALGYVGAVVDDFNAAWRDGHALAPRPIRVVMRAWYNPNLESRWNMIPALIGLLTMLQMLLLTAMSVAREREQGTLDQLLVTPFRPAEIMVGKAAPSILIGTVQVTLVLLVAQFWFRIPFAGSFVTLYLGMSVFLLAAVGMGLLVSSIVKTMQQAMLVSFLIMMPFALLSGLTTPISSMPLVLQHFTRLNPLRYAIEISHRVYLEGATLDRLSDDLWPLVALSVLAYTTAAWMFRHRLT